MEEKFLLMMKKRVNRSCVGSTILHESETWCRRKDETAILRIE